MENSKARFPELLTLTRDLTIDELRYLLGCACGEMFLRHVLRSDELENIGDIIETAHERLSN